MIKRLKLFFCVFQVLALALSEPLAYAQGVWLTPIQKPVITASNDLRSSPLLKGIKLYPNDPFRFDFILDQGNGVRAAQGADRLPHQQDAMRLIKYFLAALTVPEKDMWVNLSPYEKDRIVPEGFGKTGMGRDLLAQDYVLKQLTASLLNPDSREGRRFWDKVYAKAREKYGTSDIPVDALNKVWVVPDKAEVFERNNAVYVTQARLKVMLDSDRGHVVPAGDYVSPQPVKATQGTNPTPSAQTDVRDILREIIIPAIEQEVNEGDRFAQIRQVYNALILATWLKRKIIHSPLTMYIDHNKIAGLTASQTPEQIWQAYVKAFKQGVSSLIREEADPVSGEIIPRRYFTGGARLAVSDILSVNTQGAIPRLSSDKAQIVQIKSEVLRGDSASPSQSQQEGRVIDDAEFNRFRQWLADTDFEKGALGYDFNKEFQKVFSRDLADISDTPLYWKVFSLLRNSPQRAYMFSFWPSRDLARLLESISFIEKGLREVQTNYAVDVSQEKVFFGDVLRSIPSPLLEDPKRAVVLLQKAINDVIEEHADEFEFVIGGMVDVHAVKAFLKAFNIDQKKITILYAREESMELAEVYFPHSRIRPKEESSAIQIESMLKSKIQMGPKARPVVHIPEKLFKLDVSDRDQQELNEIRQMARIKDGRPIVVLGSPSKDDLSVFNKIYRSLYSADKHASYGDLPLLIIGNVLSMADLKETGILEQQGVAYRQAVFEGWPDLSDKNILVLNSRGELWKMYGLGGTVNIVGEDRNVMEAVSPDGAVLLFPGAWDNNKRSMSRMLSVNGAKLLTLESLKYLMDHPQEARRMGARGVEVLDHYRRGMKAYAKETLLKIIGADDILRKDFIRRLKASSDSTDRAQTPAQRVSLLISRLTDGDDTTRAHAAEELLELDASLVKKMLIKSGLWPKESVRKTVWQFMTRQRDDAWRRSLIAFSKVFQGPGTVSGWAHYSDFLLESNFLPLALMVAKSESVKWQADDFVQVRLRSTKPYQDFIHFIVQHQSDVFKTENLMAVMKKAVSPFQRAILADVLWFRAPDQLVAYLWGEQVFTQRGSYDDNNLFRLHELYLHILKNASPAVLARSYQQEVQSKGPGKKAIEWLGMKDEINMMLTSRCLFNCPKCLAKAGRFAGLPEVGKDKLKDWVDQVRGIGKIRFVGMGETTDYGKTTPGAPGFSPDFIEILEYAANNVQQVQVVTNGEAIPADYYAARKLFEGMPKNVVWALSVDEEHTREMARVQQGKCLSDVVTVMERLHEDGVIQAAYFVTGTRPEVREIAEKYGLTKAVPARRFFSFPAITQLVERTEPDKKDSSRTFNQLRHNSLVENRAILFVDMEGNVTGSKHVAFAVGNKLKSIDADIRFGNLNEMSLASIILTRFKPAAMHYQNLQNAQRKGDQPPYFGTYKKLYKAIAATLDNDPGASQILSDLELAPSIDKQSIMARFVDAMRWLSFKDRVQVVAWFALHLPGWFSLVEEEMRDKLGKAGDVEGLRQIAGKASADPAQALVISKGFDQFMARDSAQESAYKAFEAWHKAYLADGARTTLDHRKALKEIFGHDRFKGRDLDVYLEMLRLLGQDVVRGYRLALWKDEQIFKLLEVVETIARGEIDGIMLSEDFSVLWEQPSAQFYELLRGIPLNLMDDPEWLLRLLRQAVMDVIKDQEIDFQFEAYHFASLMAAKGLVSAWGLSNDQIRIYASREFSARIARKIFPEASVSNQSSYDPDINRVSFVSGSIKRGLNPDFTSALQILMTPYKYQARAHDADQIDRIKKEMRLGGRQVIVVGSPSQNEFIKVMEAYHQLYAGLSVRERPALVLGLRYPGDFLKWMLAEDKYLVRKNVNDSWPDMSDANVLVLNTVGELSLVYGLADVNLVGSDRNPIEPAGWGLPMLLFKGDWVNNIEAEDRLIRRGAAEYFSKENLLRALTEKDWARHMGQQGKLIAESFQRDISVAANLDAIYLIGSRSEYLGKFTERLKGAFQKNDRQLDSSDASQVSYQAINDDDPLFDRISFILRDHPMAMQQLAYWSPRELQDLFGIFEKINRGLSWSNIYNSKSSISVNALIRDVISAFSPESLKDPQAVINRINEAAHSVVIKHESELEFVIGGMADVHAMRTLINYLGVDRKKITILHKIGQTKGFVRRFFTDSPIARFDDSKGIKIESQLKERVEFGPNGRAEVYVPEVIFKSLIPQRDPNEIERIRRACRIDPRRQIITLGSPTKENLSQFMELYQKMYPSVASEDAGRLPLVVVGNIFEPGELENSGLLSSHKVAVRSSVWDEWPDLSHKNILLLNTIGELWTSYGLSNTVNIVGTDRNLVEAVSKDAGLLYFDGKWKDNKDVLAKLVDAGVIKGFDRYSFSAMMSDSRVFRETAERWQPFERQFEKEIKARTQDVVLTIIGADSQLRKDFIDGFSSALFLKEESDAAELSNQETKFNTVFVQKARERFGDEVMEPQDMLADWQRQAQKLVEPVFSEYQAYISRVKVDPEDVAEDDLHFLPSERFLPHDIYLTTTFKCNNNCSFCAVNAGRHYRQVISPEVAQRAFAAVKGRNDYRTIGVLGGGEATLTDIGSYLRKSHLLNTELVTNASAFKDADHARELLRDLRQANIERAPLVAIADAKKLVESFSVDISVDSGHAFDVKKIFWFIDAVFQEYPELRLGFKSVELSNAYFEELAAFINQQDGYEARYISNNLKPTRGISSYDGFIIRHQGQEKRCVIENMPRAPVGRAFVNYDFGDPLEGWKESVSQLKHPFIGTYGTVTVLPDGRATFLGFMRPPYPYWFGDLSGESWEAVLAKADFDPVFKALTEMPGDELFAFLFKDDLFSGEDQRRLQRQLKDKVVDASDYLRWILIKPERKMFISLRLLQEEYRLLVNKKKIQAMSGLKMPDFLSMSSRELERFVNYMLASVRGSVRSKLPGDDNMPIVEESLSVKPGGVDLSSDKLSLNVQSEGQGEAFKVDPAMIRSIRSAKGLTPLIIGVLPITSLDQFFSIAP